jgi:drug/metabolite transporter (DMT)-like permease
MPPRARFLPWLNLCVVYVVWGSTYLAIRIVVRDMPPFAAASLRFLVAGLGLAALAAVLERARPRPSGRVLRDYAIAGVLLLAAGNACVMWAETRVSSGLAALLVATVPVWIAVLDGLRAGGKPWTPQAWAGVVLGLVGVALVVQPGGESRAVSGIVALQGGALSWTLGVLWVQSRPQKLPALSASAVEMLAASAVLFVESRLAGEDLSRMARAPAAAWLALAFLIVFGSMIAFTAFAYVLDHMPASIAGTYAYVNPLVAVALGHAVLGEALSSRMAVGAGLIVAAVVLVTRQGLTREEPLAEAG